MECTKRALTAVVEAIDVSPKCFFFLFFLPICLFSIPINLLRISLKIFVVQIIFPLEGKGAEHLVFYDMLDPYSMMSNSEYGSSSETYPSAENNWQ